MTTRVATDASNSPQLERGSFVSGQLAADCPGYCGCAAWSRATPVPGLLRGANKECGAKIEHSLHALEDAAR